MSTNLLFNFKIDKSTSTLFVDKEFDAELSLVWDAFTKQEILDQWWAPKPLISKTKYMDFRVGGRRFYAMVSPDGAEIGWQIFDYTSITPKSNFKCLSFFADKDETPHLPGANWDLTFSEQNARPPARFDHSGGGDHLGRGITKVSISIYFESFEELEKMIEMGFKEGFTVTLNELTSLLKTLKK
jgi:uncharacterized protein YndB with AHSA1/START domain